MAGSGKSHWSKRLAAKGFHRFCCDDLIEEKLRCDLTAPDGTPLKLGPWMGFPWEWTYESREATYLDKESEVLQEILRLMSEKRLAENVVVDTTGSVIYAPEGVLAKLRHMTLMVYLPVPVEFRASLLQSYRSRPHPLVWHGMFRPMPGESNEEALTRCYPKLVSSREQFYERYADLRVGFHQRRQNEFTADDFLALIRGVRGPRDRG
jgi:shikimate kinase